MKILSLLAGASISLSPCAFSQQLIADSIASPGASPGLGSILTLGSSASTSEGGVTIGGYSSSGLYGTAIGWGTWAGDYAFAAGGGQAMGEYSTAIGSNYVSGSNSCAIGGYGNDVLGDNSYAFGYGTSAWSNDSWAYGYYTATSSDYSISLGSKNLSSSTYQSLNDDWTEDAVLFELGNGEPTGSDHYRYNLSNAITTLKNGRTTLTNKAWLNRDSSTSPTADPSSATTDSGGEALVVEGHTRLKGKVIIEQPQGDISMGIYQ
jgi:hypothetical protein